MNRKFRLGLIGGLASPLLTMAFISGPAGAAPSQAVPPVTPAVACAGATAPTNNFPGTTVTANNFESGTLAGFTVNTGTTGTATIDNKQAHSGTCSAHLHVTSDKGSLANLVTALPANSNNVYADAWFNITTAGVAGNDVPYFRFFFDTTRFVDIYRYNSNGQMWLRVTIPSTGTTPAFNYTKLVSGTIALNAWRHVGMHVVANGAASTVEVWLDGTSIYSSNKVDTTATTVTAVQLGAEHLTQMGDEYIDDLVIKNASAINFADIRPGQAFYNEISWLAAQGISQGWLETNGTRTFRPALPIARDQMAAFMYRLAGSPVFTPLPVFPFVDIPTSQPFYEDISWLAAKGISNGWLEANGTHTYRAGDPVNRDQMAAFLYRMAGSPAFTLPAVSPFRDVVPGQTFYKEITWLAAQGISYGWPEADGTHTFRAGQPVNRDQMAAFLYRYNAKFPHS